MSFIAIYDACVIYPAATRDRLLEIAFADLVSAKWTKQIHHEWIRNLAANRPDISEDQLWLIANKMDKIIPDSLVENYESIIEGLELTDLDDRHVLAAAIKANAQVIVTTNLKDFPPDYLNQMNIEPVHPDIFLVNQLDLSVGSVVSCVKKIRSRLKNPKYTPSGYLENLAANGLTVFAGRMEEFIDLI